MLGCPRPNQELRALGRSLHMASCVFPTADQVVSTEGRRVEGTTLLLTLGMVSLVRNAVDWSGQSRGKEAGNNCRE